jgi:hypothetical protein
MDNTMNEILDDMLGKAEVALRNVETADVEYYELLIYVVESFDRLQQLFVSSKFSAMASNKVAFAGLCGACNTAVLRSKNERGVPDSIAVLVKVIKDMKLFVETIQRVHAMQNVRPSGASVVRYLP